MIQHFLHLGSIFSAIDYVQCFIHKNKLVVSSKGDQHGVVGPDSCLYFRRMKFESRFIDRCVYTGTTTYQHRITLQGEILLARLSLLEVY